MFFFLELNVGDEFVPAVVTHEYSVTRSLLLLQTTAVDGVVASLMPSSCCCVHAEILEREPRVG